MSTHLKWTQDASARVIDINGELPPMLLDQPDEADCVFGEVWAKFASDVLGVNHGYDVDLVRVEFWPDGGWIHIIPSRTAPPAVGRMAQMNLRVSELLHAWQAYETAPEGRDGQALQAVHKLARGYANELRAAACATPALKTVSVEFFLFSDPLPKQPAA